MAELVTNEVSDWSGGFGVICREGTQGGRGVGVNTASQGYGAESTALKARFEGFLCDFLLIAVGLLVRDLQGGNWSKPFEVFCV